jgi:hypothetical protein
MYDDEIAVLRADYQRDLKVAQDIQKAGLTGRISIPDIPRDILLRGHAQSVAKAESMIELLENTIIAHLGTAGPMGAVAEQQLRILAEPYL